MIMYKEFVAGNVAWKYLSGGKGVFAYYVHFSCEQRMEQACNETMNDTSNFFLQENPGVPGQN